MSNKEWFEMDMYKMWCGNHCSNSEYMGGIKYDGCI